VLGSAFSTGPDLPPFLQAQLLFPYTGGMAFVQELVHRAGWRRAASGVWGEWATSELVARASSPLRPGTG